MNEAAPTYSPNDNDWHAPHGDAGQTHTLTRPDGSTLEWTNDPEDPTWAIIDTITPRPNQGTATFTKHHGDWAIKVAASDWNPGATITVTSSKGIKTVTMGSPLDGDLNGQIVCQFTDTTPTRARSRKPAAKSQRATLARLIRQAPKTSTGAIITSIGTIPAPDIDTLTATETADLIGQLTENEI